MRRGLFLLIILCLFAISARLKLIGLHQQKYDAMEKLHLLCSAAITLEIPLSGNKTWEDLLEKNERGC